MRLVISTLHDQGVGACLWCKTTLSIFCSQQLHTTSLLMPILYLCTAPFTAPSIPPFPRDRPHLTLPLRALPLRLFPPPLRSLSAFLVRRPVSTTYTQTPICSVRSVSVPCPFFNLRPPSFPSHCQGCCADWEASTRRKVTSTSAGVLFGLAWWILIDAVVVTNTGPYQVPFIFGFYVPGEVCLPGRV